MRYSTAPGLLRVAWRSALLCTAVCAFVCLDAQRASGQDRLEREGRIRAALILNIAKLVTWPAESTAELTICVYDEAGFITPLATIEGEMVQGRRVTVMEIDETSAAVGCQIVFIGPRPESIRLMGDKAKARGLMRKNGIPILSGSDGTLEDSDEALKIAHRIKYPVIIKAAGGGGGRTARRDCDRRSDP